jgi:glutamyl-tRNA synthetase
MRVRFAPSPTGFLHVGGGRTALYNWLLARHSGGAFILRIEDTDTARSTQEYYQAIVEDLKWLGLDWDEGPEVGGPRGPYFQSERAGSYGPAIERLIADGSAYRCFCTKEELEERRGRAPKEGRDWRYDRRCLELADEERERLLKSGAPASVRFRVPDGATVVDDLILGRVEFDNSELDDLVIARTDGTPTYNFVVVVDDLEMGVTHVIRGSDHLSNTPKQVLIARALGGTPPTYGHLPLVLAQDGKVLSKRRGAVAIGEYRRSGYLPEALMNYLALLGWAYDGVQEIFQPDELVEKFEVGKVSRKPAAFDPDKLLWMNEQWIKSLPVSERTDRVLPFLTGEGLIEAGVAGEERDRLEKIVETIGDRLKTLNDITDQAGFFLASDVIYDSMSVKKVLAKPGADETLAGLQRILEGAPDFEPETLERIIRAHAQERGLSLGKLVQPVRVAVTGRTASPGIFETLSLLGRDKTLSRIEDARGLTNE